jgi:hypothetical protein
MEQVGREISYRISAHLAGRVRQVILGQELIDEWVPLSLPYLRRKMRLRLDTRMLRATGEYLQSIQARRSGDGYFTAPADNRHHMDPRVAREGDEDAPTLYQIGMWLEYGTFRWEKEEREGGETVSKLVSWMPARPHWRPVWSEFMDHKGEVLEEMRRRVWTSRGPEIIAAVEKEIRLAGTLQVG